MDLSPVLALCVHLAGVIAFVWFVFYWANLFSRRIEPLLRGFVSQRLGIEIIRWERGPRYHWITPDPRPRSQALVFVWGAALFLGLGLVPMGVALVGIGLILNAING
ncbi:MAG: hypothetical protein K8J31_31305 [Anaerolineae bacterium]|nr:hypothetical protein [Anaerolineae bacterium]